MNKFLSCLAASLLFSVSNFATAEQSPNFLLNESFLDVTAQPATLPTHILQNDARPFTAGNSITIINHSNRRACVTAISANPVVASGWYVFENGETKTLNALSYFRAEECGTGGSVYWNPGWDMQYFCLKYGPAFNIYTPGNATMCTNLGGQMKPHYRLPGNVTLTLNY